MELNWSTCNSINSGYWIGIKSRILTKKRAITRANFEVMSFFQIAKNKRPAKIETFMFPVNKIMKNLEI